MIDANRRRQSSTRDVPALQGRAMTTGAARPSSGSIEILGKSLNRGFQAYADHWQRWIAPILLSAVVVIVSWLCLCIPYLIVMGPLGCGLFACALRALRGEAF